ncbi:histidine kinase [Cloacibacterium sp.]|uniref:histidine kinase n=1 Tax=Cloacibacterium sp. TaxID=1913682 RepID=UPI0039E2B093
MRKLLLIATLLVTTLFSAQNAKQIIDKNIEITGGLINWKLLNSILLQGKVILGVSEEYPLKIYQQRPNLTKTVITVGKKENVVEGYDGKNGYSMNYVVNKLQIQKDYVAESFDTDFIDFENKGFSAQVLGKEKVGERECFKVELIKNVNRTVYFFDVQNFFLLKEVKKDETLIYSEFKKVNGLIMPFRIEASTPKKEGDYVMILNRIDTNKAFPANTFKF